MISNSQSFISQILKVVSRLGKKLFSFSPLGFEIQKDYNINSETLNFKLQSFRAFQRVKVHHSQVSDGEVNF